jgi:hypothetical protein
MDIHNKYVKWNVLHPYFHPYLIHTSSMDIPYGTGELEK